MTLKDIQESEDKHFAFMASIQSLIEKGLVKEVLDEKTGEIGYVLAVDADISVATKKIREQ